jgi:hypothetical protein
LIRETIGSFGEEIMLSYKDLFENELNDRKTNYFILDTYGKVCSSDDDLGKYYWDTNKFV